MGSSHAVDIIFNINWHLAGLDMLRSRRSHWDAVLGSGPIALFRDGASEPLGVVWEMFAGSARWTQACRAAGFWYLTPIELADDSCLDLSSPLFVEKVLAIAATGRVAALHCGTPCSSLSQAISPPWRSAEFPTGLPGLVGPAKQ